MLYLTDKMEENGDTLYVVESRHKKEKKELQAQVQALKKAAKNDKTKKKDLSAEIVRLESELEVRHKQELEAIQLEPVVNGETMEECENEIAKVKISKAQKRRDKKSQLEKVREEQIKLQEKDNINGPRNIEIQAICEKLKKNKLKLFQIPSDGDCLYKAVSHQLETTRKISHSVDELRTKVATYLKEHKDDFIHFMSNPDTCDMLTDDQFVDYCDKTANTKVWGGQLEIRALSNCLKCPISVIQATGPDSIEQGTEYEGAPLIITYHRHMYNLGEHYNSTCLIEEVEEKID